MCRHPVVAQSEVFLHFISCSDDKVCCALSHRPVDNNSWNILFPWQFRASTQCALLTRSQFPSPHRNHSVRTFLHLPILRPWDVIVRPWEWSTRAINNNNNNNRGNAYGAVVMTKSLWEFTGSIWWMSNTAKQLPTHRPRPHVGQGTPLSPVLPCPFTSSSFAFFAFLFLSLALPIVFYYPSLSFLP